MPFTLNELISFIVSWSRSVARRISGRSFDEIFVFKSVLNSAKSSSSVLGVRGLGVAVGCGLEGSGLDSPDEVGVGSGTLARLFAASAMRALSFSRAVSLLYMSCAKFSVIFSGYSTNAGSAYKRSRVTFVAIGNSSFE